mmetsp:Transcript_11484/g.23312  ORF Transcript_11484/g.23312 Transcript_11484/m.23312 type:complete len:160 (+) Transcript_11484:484-963(+)
MRHAMSMEPNGTHREKRCNVRRQDAKEDCQCQRERANERTIHIIHPSVTVKDETIRQHARTGGGTASVIAGACFCWLSMRVLFFFILSSQGLNCIVFHCSCCCSPPVPTNTKLLHMHTNATQRNATVSSNRIESNSFPHSIPTLATNTNATQRHVEPSL